MHLIAARAAGGLFLAAAVLCCILAPSVPVFAFTLLSGITFTCAVFLDGRFADVAPAVRASSQVERDLVARATPPRLARRNDLAPQQSHRSRPSLRERTIK